MKIKNILKAAVCVSTAVMLNQASAEYTSDNAQHSAENVAVNPFTTLSEGDPVYVSDAANVWVRRCAQKDCRIIDTKHVGDKLKFKALSRDREFVLVDDGSDKVQWMLARDLQVTPCGKARVAELEEQVESLKSTLANYDSVLARDYQNAKAALEKLEKENASLKIQLKDRNQAFEDLDASRRDMADKLQTKDMDMQMRWWMQGAAIAFCGALIGIICVYIPRPGKKKKTNRF